MKFGRHLAISAVVASLGLAGCLGDGTNSTTSDSTSRTGKIAVLMTDAPVAADTFEHIYLTVTAVTLLSDDDDDEEGSRDSARSVVLFEGNETIDLLNLTNHSELFALTDVPAGDYEKIRLTVSEIELVKATGPDTTESYFPHLPGNGKIDLNPRGSIHVEADRTLIVQLDVDAEKSIHIVERGKNDEYNFRPVIFVDIITGEFSGKLVRHSGYVNDLNLTAGTFDLCDAPKTELTVDDQCIDVTTSNASVFAQNGDPTATSTLANDQYVTVVGFLGFPVSPLATAVDIQLITPVLHGEVIEIGKDVWTVNHGVATSEPATATGSFTLSPDSSTSLTAQLQLGTKVFARDGTRLDYTAIDTGREVAVDAVADSTNNTLLKTSLVVVNTHALLDHISGSVKSVDYLNRRLVVTTTTGDVTVVADDDTTVFEISQVGDTVLNNQVIFGNLQVSDVVTVYGHTQLDASVKAEVVIIDSTQP